MVLLNARGPAVSFGALKIWASIRLFLNCATTKIQHRRGKARRKLSKNSAARYKHAAQENKSRGKTNRQQRKHRARPVCLGRNVEILSTHRPNTRKKLTLPSYENPCTGARVTLGDGRPAPNRCLLGRREVVRLPHVAHMKHFPNAVGRRLRFRYFYDILHAHLKRP